MLFEKSYIWKRSHRIKSANRLMPPYQPHYIKSAALCKRTILVSSSIDAFPGFQMQCTQRPTFPSLLAPLFLDRLSWWVVYKVERAKSRRNQHFLDTKMNTSFGTGMDEEERQGESVFVFVAKEVRR